MTLHLYVVAGVKPELPLHRGFHRWYPQGGLAFPVTVLFSYCLSLPSATLHEDDSLVLVCLEPSQG